MHGSMRRREATHGQSASPCGPGSLPPTLPTSSSADRALSRAAAVRAEEAAPKTISATGSRARPSAARWTARSRRAVRLIPDRCDAGSVAEAQWYTALRDVWEPDSVRVLLVGESAPDPGDAQRRFFYAPTLTRADNLFRAVVKTFYGQSPGRAGDAKAPWLERLRDDGVFLVDLVPFPVNRLAPGERRKALRAHADALVAEATARMPDGVVVCHGPTFRATADALRAAGVAVLHDHAIPFPIGNWQARFVAEVRQALVKIDGGWTPAW